MPLNLLMNTYNVLWLDDKFEEYGDFVNEAKFSDIVLKGFKSFESGFAHLEQNIFAYDAVLLDAMFFEYEDQVDGMDTVVALRKAINRLAELRGKRNIPYFIQSGQPGYQKDKQLRSAFSERYYDKSNPNDSTALFKDIKREADAQLETQMRHRYADAFAACTSQYAGERAGRLLYEALAAVHKPELTHGDDLAFNTLRQILEEVFMAACSHNLLPPECLANGKVNITNSGQLLSGKTVKVSNTHQAKLHDALLPEALADLIYTVISLTHNGSHAAAPATSSRLISLRQSVRTPYLQAALTYQILDLLVWFKVLLDDTTTAARTGWYYAALPASGAAIAGKIEKLTSSGGAIFIADADGTKASISPPLVTSRSLTAGQTIQVVLHDLISVKRILV